MYEIKVLRPGYAISLGPAKQKAAGTITLIKGNKNIIVDTGIPTDRRIILERLKREEIKPDQIDYVICTHGHSDHVSNNNLFPNATFILQYDISKKDNYTFYDFKKIGQYKIDDNVEVIFTPGHTDYDLSVVVKTSTGVIAITGDLFECKEDLHIPRLWQDFTGNLKKQADSRRKVLQIADYIVPGHGDIFKVEKEQKPYKKKVFLSSTISDLKDLRPTLASLLGASGIFEVVYSESANFPLKKGVHAHDICLDMVKECDVYILVVDRRYGETYAGTMYPKKNVSITWYEYIIAYQEDKEIYTFVRKEIWDERGIYKAHKKKYQRGEIKTLYADDMQVLEFIEYINNQPKYNWVNTFNTVNDLLEILKKQLKI